MNKSALLKAETLGSPVDLQAFFQSSSDLLIEHDASLICCAANPTAIALWQVQPDDWIGKSTQAVIDAGLGELSAQRFMQQLLLGLQHLLVHGEPQQQVYEIETGGKRRFFDLCHTLLPDQTGAIARIVSVGREITAYYNGHQNAVQDGLSSSTQPFFAQPIQHLIQPESLVQLVLENLPYGIFWKDQHSVYQGCNQTWAAIVGLADPQEIIGKTDYDFAWCEADADSYRELDQAVMTSGAAQINVLTSRLDATGQQVWFHGTKIPLHGADGTVLGIVCLFELITEQQRAANLNQSAELLQLVLDNIPQSLFWKDRDLTYLGCNRNWAKAAGFQNLVEVVGKTDYDLIWKDEADLYRSQDCEVMETDTPVLHLVEHRLNADGQESWIDVNKIPIHDSEDNVIGLLGTIEDITDRKLAEIALQKSEAQLRLQTEQLEQTLRELRQTQAQLVQTEKMSSLGQLVAGIAHEINNPVNFIYGNVIHANDHIRDLLGLIRLYQQHYSTPAPQIQEEIVAIDLEFLLEDLPKLLASMKVGAERIQAIVQALRNFSRMDEAEVKVVDIHAGIDSTLMILHSRLKARADAVGIQVVKEYGDLPAVECYAGQLNQVFMNILSNAIDALEEGMEQKGQGAEVKQLEKIGSSVQGIKAETSLSRTSHPTPMIRIQTEVTDTQHVRIRIADNGAGMTEAVRNRLFDPFFTTKPVGKGTGLGLSISYQIVVERHQGSLQCVSQPGQGTEFQIEIPLTQKVS